MFEIAVFSCQPVVLLDPYKLEIFVAEDDKGLITDSEALAKGVVPPICLPFILSHNSRSKQLQEQGEVCGLVLPHPLLQHIINSEYVSIELILTSHLLLVVQEYPSVPLYLEWSTHKISSRGRGH